MAKKKSNPGMVVCSCGGEYFAFKVRKVNGFTGNEYIPTTDAICISCKKEVSLNG